MSDKQIRFIGTDGGTLFTIPDGGSVVISHESGEQHVMDCNYVDETHFETQGARYSHNKHAAMLADRGTSAAPETAPEYHGGYRIVARIPAGEQAVVLGHAPHRRLPWATWQLGCAAPGVYSCAIYRPERMDAVDDLYKRGNALRQGIPYQADRDSDKHIRFITPDYKERFTIPDGGSIVISYPDGEERAAECKFLDECHTAVDGECYHICQFAEIMRNAGAEVEPETAPEIVQGYHILRRMSARDKVMVMGHNPRAPQPWVTWQGDRDSPGDYNWGHYYGKREHARIDLAKRAAAERHGTPYTPYRPPEAGKTEVPEA